MTHLTGMADELLPHPESLEIDRGHHAPTLELARAIRPRLAAELASLSDDDLMVQGVFLCGRKRSGQRPFPRPATSSR